MTRALVTTTPARAYTICHPDGRLVAEVLWGDFGRPVLSRYYEDRAVHTPERVASWPTACNEAQEWARDEWGLDVGEPDDLPVGVDPEPPPADPVLLAQANCAMDAMVREMEQERDRLREVVRLTEESCAAWAGTSAEWQRLFLRVVEAVAPECMDDHERAAARVVERVEELEAALKGDHRTLAPGAVQAARMLERERVVAWLRTFHVMEVRDAADMIEHGEHEEDGNG